MRLSLPRWLILLGVVAGLLYWKQRQRKDQVLVEPTASKPTNAIDDALKTGIAEVGKVRQLTQALEAAVDQILDLLRQVRRSIPSTLSEGPAEHVDHKGE